MARDVSAVADWLEEAIAQADTLPFTPAIPEAQRPDVERCWEDLFGGWKWRRYGVGLTPAELESLGSSRKDMLLSMKSRTAALAFVGGIVASAATVLAVKYGELDGNHHPYVGLMVALDAEGDPLWRCTGTLMSPTLYLTAGHCTEAPAARVKIWFDADVESGIPGNGYPFPATWGPLHASAVQPQRLLPCDLGVVSSTRPYPPAYGKLPKLTSSMGCHAARQAGRDLHRSRIRYAGELPDAAGW